MFMKLIYFAVLRCRFMILVMNFKLFAVILSLFIVSTMAFRRKDLRSRSAWIAELRSKDSVPAYGFNEYDDLYDHYSEDQMKDDGLSEAEKMKILKELVELKKKGDQQSDDELSEKEKIKILKELVELKKGGKVADFYDEEEDDDEEEDSEDQKFHDKLSEAEKMKVLEKKLKELVALKKKGDQQSDDELSVKEKMKILKELVELKKKGNQKSDAGLSKGEKMKILKELVELKTGGKVSQDHEEKEDKVEDKSEEYRLADFIVQKLLAMKDE